MWVSRHHCLIALGHAPCLCCVVLLLSKLAFIIKQASLTLTLSDLFCCISQAGPPCFRIFPLLSWLIINLINGVSKLTIWSSSFVPIRHTHRGDQSRPRGSLSHAYRTFLPGLLSSVILLCLVLSPCFVCLRLLQGFPDSSAGKESACNAETLVQFLGWEDPLEKG